jgi:hypothetical protein
MIFTTRDGVIEWVDAAGADLLHLSPAGCQGRDLIRFFANNRVPVIEAMHAARSGGVVQGSGAIRPLDRKPRPVRFTVSPDPEQAGSLK